MRSRWGIGAVVTSAGAISGKDCDMIKAMQNQIEISVEWGDIDQAAIVFYPNYFKWFDIGTRHLLDAAGVSYSTLQSELGLVGLPLVEASSRFLSPIRFGDTVRLASYVSSWRRKTVEISHRVEVDGRCCAEGREVRVIARGTNGQIQAVTPPARLLQALPVHQAAADARTSAKTPSRG